MKFVFVLEDDPKYQIEISQAIEKNHPQIQIRFFTSLKSFSEWLKVLLEKGRVSLSTAGVPAPGTKVEAISGEDHQLVLVISKIEFLGSEQLPLLRKTRDLFVRKNVCTPEDPTSFVLTTFGDSPNYNSKDLENKILSNVICKPFDKLILTQHLTFAIDGRHPPSQYVVAQQKTTAIIEMLKDVNLEAISEIGFLTRSYRKIDVGMVAKYYGEAFFSDRHKSIMGILVDCRPHPKFVDEFQCVFSYLSADQTQISRIRRRVRTETVHRLEFAWSQLINAKGDSNRPVEIVIVDADYEMVEELKELIQRRFSNTHITHFGSWIAFLAEIDEKKAAAETLEIGRLGASRLDSVKAKPTGPQSASDRKLPAKIDLLLATDQLFRSEAEERWSWIKEKFSCSLYILSGAQFSDAMERDLGRLVRDIFFKPLDRTYFSQKLLFYHPQLKVSGDPLGFLSMNLKTEIQTANPVTISEISEAGLILNYYRAISAGSFRQFILWQPYEYGAPQLKAACNFSESKSPNNFSNHFVFFGMTDAFLKSIRLWIRDNYVLAKEKSG